MVICYERTFHTERKAQWYRTLYRKTVLHWVDAMACNGSMSAAYAQWLGMPAERITLGHMAADTEGMQKAVDALAGKKRWALRRRWGEPELVFLVVARLIELKGGVAMAWLGNPLAGPPSARGLKEGGAAVEKAKAAGAGAPDSRPLRGAVATRQRRAGYGVVALPREAGEAPARRQATHFP